MDNFKNILNSKIDVCSTEIQNFMTKVQTKHAEELTKEIMQLKGITITDSHEQSIKIESIDYIHFYYPNDVKIMINDNNAYLSYNVCVNTINIVFRNINWD